jgi:hypothetical protein
LANTPTRISFQPSWVLTHVPSVSNSAFPAAFRYRWLASGACACQSATRGDSCWQTLRTVLGETFKPLNSSRYALDCPNDQLAPARHNKRSA